MSINCRLIFIPLIISFIPLISSLVEGFTITRNVSVDVADFNLGIMDVYFACPNIRSKKDIIKYYNIIDNKPILLKEKRTAYGIILKLKGKADLGRYECSVLSENGSTRNATLNIMDKNIILSPTTFVYNNDDTVYVSADSGPVELSCGLSDTQEITWYKPPQYHISSGNKLKIDNVDQYDYGTYYCAAGDTRKTSVKVQKIILTKGETPVKEPSIDSNIDYVESLITRSNIVRYRSRSLVKNSDVVVWEKPPGTILLNHGRDLYLKSSEVDSSPYYYRVTRNGDMNINITGKLILSQKLNEDVPMDIQEPLSYGGKMQIDCVSPSEFDKETEVVWKRDGVIVHRGNTLLIKKFQKESFGKYSCEIIRGKQELKTRFINLMPEQKIESKIELTPEPGNYYLYHPGSKKELHCEIGRENNAWRMKAKDIVWTFNDRKVDVLHPDFKAKFGRLDTNSVSILVLNNMNDKHEGTYKCYQNSTILAARLLMERSDLLVELAPSEQTVADNVNQGAEIHCRIDTANINSSSIKWKFIPDKSQTEVELPEEAKVERPILTSSTSFVVIDNVLKRHEGTYVCQVLDKKVYGRLIVKTKPVLKVNPKTITIKPGGTARFLCLLNGIEGKVIWRRMDKRALELNRENRMGGSSQSLLEVKQVTINDHGTIYECFFNNLVEQVTLFVEEECALHQRKCRNGTCIDESKFCDGKNDCGDNSDEDRKKCNECSPNAIHCDFLKNASPTKRCIVKHWQCDGIDDCGNNFDELNCPDKNKDQCIGTHFLCNDKVLIPRSYWCDGEPDCESKEDEDDCSQPEVVEPAKQMQISVFENSTLELVCQMTGRPVPTITWRYNWGHLSENLNYNISSTISKCNTITSTLTVYNINSENSGIYSCEGIARRRVIAPDFSVTVSKGSICKRPYYNYDAWYSDMCIKCHCSGVTDDCTSATGYTINPNPIESGIKPSDAAIVNFRTIDYFAPAREITFANMEMKKYFINKLDYKNLVPNPDYYFGGAFNMEGSWLTRYGLPLIYKLTLGGETDKYIPGPLLMIKGEYENVYYCGVSSNIRLPVYASNDNYENNMRVTLWEQDSWYSDYLCTKAATRQDFLNVLRKVNLILFKIKYFEGQTDFKMSKISMTEAIETKDKYSWVGKLEKCNCPSGYSGLSCEINLNQP